ncbi:phage tail spike protein [Staphylococcus chromogenes]|uniref:phage tail spike protein n=1 Tax=Staphylococcus chromogenes TaxID=46126 RepID=UPI002902EBEC|nr:phage tail spike protein [Staphylococcus chromogenes]MDU0429217.1 phage tail spike protein [Staphylococcus chromogenes]
MIHVLNFEDKIIDYISKRDSSIVTAEHSQNIEEDTETFELTIHSDKAENLRRRVKLVVEMLDGTYREFFVSEIEDNVVEKETTLTCVASYLEDLSKAKPIPPQKITKQTLIEMLDFGLRGTGWDRGNVDYMGEKSRSWTAYATPYEYLKMLRTTFGHEYRFVIEIEGRKVKRRRVDCVKPEPLFNGREIVYGKDLLGMTRSIDMSEVVTAYIGLGPEKDNGEREVVEVVDDEVQESFDLPENYLWGIYEPESEDQDMTKERLTTLTRTALNKAKSRVFSYEVTSLDVKKQFGHELVQIGDIVRIKNRDFKPPIYADGRIIEITSDLMAERQTYKLGEIKEYDENKLRAYFNSIKSLLTKKVNDDINNMNTIIIDNIQDLEIFERNISKGAEPPLNPVENQLWYDTSNPEVAILREYVNGQWINATAEDVRDIGGFTREQTIYNDLDNTMDNLLAQHTQLQTLYDNLYNSEYLVDDVLKQDYKAKYDDLNAQFLIAKNLFDSLDLEHATIGKLMDVQAAIVEYRNKLQTFYLISQQVDKSISERIKLLQSQYTDEKYNEAMKRVAETFGIKQDENGAFIGPPETIAEMVDALRTETKEEMSTLLKRAEYETDKNGIVERLNASDSERKQLSNEINDRVTITEYNAGMEEKTNEINNLNIGSENLLLNSEIRSDFSTYPGYSYIKYDLIRPLEIGKNYTLKADIVTNDERQSGQSSVFPYSPNGIRDIVDIKDGKITYTFTAQSESTQFLIYKDVAGQSNADLEVIIEKAILVEGDKVTDWSPANEDIKEDIQQAETNAKAYTDAQKKDTDVKLIKMNTDISQNGKDIQLRATKEEFNQSRKTLSQVISELTNSTMNGLTYTYDENGSIQSFNVGPNGTSINTSKLTIDAGDVSLKDGVFTVKSVNTNNVTIPRTDGGVPTIINGTDKRESAITGTTPPFKQKLSGNVPVFYESGYWLGCLKRTTDQEYLSYDAFYFTHDRRYLSVSVIFLVGQKATTDPNERTVGEFIKLEEFSPPPSIESQYLINEFKGFATTAKEQDGGGRVQYTFVKDLGPPTGLPRQFYFKVKPNAEGVANPLFDTSKPYSMAKFQIRKTILYG